MRRYRPAMMLITFLSIGVVWLVIFGPAIPSMRTTGFALAATVIAVVVVTWLAPKRLAMMIPLLLLVHHAVITRQAPGWITIAAALLLIPLLPGLYRLLSSKPRVLITASSVSIALAFAAAAILCARVDVRTWTSRTRVAAPRTGNNNVVLIVLDTLRADRIGAYGYRARPVTPFLDSFARQATTFPRTYATSSWTIPSVGSMFTGLTCGQHGIFDGHTPLPASPTLAETLRGAGYFTEGISANFALDEEIGFTRGFDRYTVLWRMVRGNRTSVPSIWDDLNSVLINYYRGWIATVPGWNWKPRAADVTLRASRALDLAPRDRPLFLFVQYVDPHAPCDPISRNRFESAQSDRAYDEKWSLQYDREIRDLDDALRTLVANVDRRLDPKNTVVIIVADHGEQIGEEGERGHGRNLSEATIRVPLIVRSPTLAPGVGPQEAFSVARIFDLIRASAGIAVPATTTRIANSSLRIGNMVDRAVIEGPYKFVQRTKLDPASIIHEALYVLPDEKHDAQAQNRAVADRLRAALAADPLPRKRDAGMSDEMRAKFRALGYLR
jgi:sulfatase-like protein